MAVGGFRVRLDLSQFFNDIKKFSCIYVDLSRDRQIADVVDRILELFGIERPLCLLDERFYLPESENVNVLRDSNIVKVLKAFHFEDKESCSTTDHPTKRAKGVDYLIDEIHSEQVSVQNNKADISENEEVDSSSVSHTDKAAFHELHSKKRKREVVDISNCINSVNVLQQDLEPEVHYQKKCKRKKERVKKEILNGSTIEPIEDEIEEKSSESLHFDNQSNKKKKKNKAAQINGDITEEKVVSGLLNHNPLENVSDLSEVDTCEFRRLKKHKKKRKEDLASVDACKSLDSESLHSMELKKCKKKLSQNDAEIDVAQDRNLSTSCKTTDTTFLASCSQGARNESTSMCQNIDDQVNSSVKNYDSIVYTDSDIAHTAVNSTQIFAEGCRSTEVPDILLQDNTSMYDSILENHLDNATNSAISIKPKPKRKRTRVRKHKKRNRLLNDSVFAFLPVVQQPADLQYGVSPRKHIRFQEVMDDDLKENTNHKDVLLNDDEDMRNNTTEEIYNSKASPNVSDKCALELTRGTEVTDCHMKNSFEYSTPNNLTSKNNTTSLPSQIPLHQQWALNTADPNMDSKESLQKLLTLGKQNAAPVVFERKSQCNNSGSASDSLVPVVKQNNGSAGGTHDIRNTAQLVDVPDMTCLKTNPNAIDPLSYPQLQGKPKKNDIIAFKKLKMTSNYTPVVSDFIIATVLDICEDTMELSLQIEVGESDLEAPKGKFSLEIEDSEKNNNDSKLCQLNWNELMDVRILFP